MLATLTDAPFSRAGWLFEPKWDGVRCLVFRDRGGVVRLVSRNEKSLNERFPQLVAAIGQQSSARAFIADGEVVAFAGKTTSFEKLQQGNAPVTLCLFDLLYLDGYDLRDLPLRYRKQVLRESIDFRATLRFTDHRERDGEAYFRHACRSGWEGLIAKVGDGRYVSGRSDDWLKAKCRLEQEFVVGGYTDPQRTRVGLGALLLGYYQDGDLVYAGKVGTGFDNATLQRLRDQLAKFEKPTSPFTVIAGGMPRSTSPAAAAGGKTTRPASPGRTGCCTPPSTRGTRRCVTSW
jgi:bifunctional non-homologous end joining protein LigD